MNKHSYEPDGTPIMCKCGCTHLVEKDHSYLDSYGPLLEFGVYCSRCWTRVNYWAYGYWEYTPEKE